MDMDQIFKLMIEQAQKKSSAMLIERCEKSSEHPYGIKLAAPLEDDEIAVVALPGTVNRSETLKACNGMLKRLTNFIEGEKKLKNIKVRPLIAVCDFGDYFDKELAKKLLLLEQNDPKKALEILRSLSLAERQEYLTPNYVKDIYHLVVHDRLAKTRIRLPQAQALRNIRRTIFVPYCWGGYTAIKLERFMQDEMLILHYNPEERLKIQSQMLVVAQSPSCPIGISKSRMVSFSSASDLVTKHNNYVKEYLNMTPHGCRDFGYLWLDSKEGNIFYCTKFNKLGVEGNPIKYRLVKIESWDDLMKPLPNEEKTIGEHDFIGFEPRNDMSNAAKKIQHFRNNILINGIIHAANQPKESYHMLPNTRRLAADTPKEHWDLFQAYRLGLALKLNIQDYGKDKILQDSYAANMQFVSFE